MAPAADEAPEVGDAPRAEALVAAAEAEEKRSLVESAAEAEVERLRAEGRDEAKQASDRFTEPQRELRELSGRHVSEAAAEEAALAAARPRAAGLSERAAAQHEEGQRRARGAEAAGTEGGQPQRVGPRGSAAGARGPRPRSPRGGPAWG